MWSHTYIFTIDCTLVTFFVRIDQLSRCEKWWIDKYIISYHRKIFPQVVRIIIYISYYYWSSYSFFCQFKEQTWIEQNLGYFKMILVFSMKKKVWIWLNKTLFWTLITNLTSTVITPNQTEVIHIKNLIKTQKLVAFSG